MVSSDFIHYDKIAVFLFLVSLWIKYIQNPIIDWINNGDDAKWR